MKPLVIRMLRSSATFSTDTQGSPLAHTDRGSDYKSKYSLRMETIPLDPQV